MTHPTAAFKIKRFQQIVVIALLALAGVRTYAAEASKAAPEAGLAPILTYISSGWDTLTRSMTDCQTVVDPKLTEASVLYLPADFPASPAVRDLQKRCKVQVRPLPAVITAPGQIDPRKIAPGLLDRKSVV